MLHCAILLCCCFHIKAEQTDNACRPTLPDWLLPSEERIPELPVESKDEYARIGRIPMTGGPSSSSFLSLGGQIRQWYESFQTPPFGLGPKDQDGYLLQRYMLHLDAHINNTVRLFVDFTGNIENGRVGGPRPGIDEDRGDIHQAFVDVTLFHSGQRRLSLRLGRQEMVFGSGRFVDIREGPNVRLSFDGAKLTYCSAKVRLDAFATKPVDTREGSVDDIPAHNTSFWGLYATRTLRMRVPSNLDVYYFGFDQKRSAYARGAGREQRQTIGTRLASSSGSWDYDYEIATQLGRFAGRGIRAWAASTNTGYRFRALRYQPRLGAKLDVASGDSGASGQSVGTWNPLFASLHYFGEEGIAGPSNF